MLQIIREINSREGMSNFEGTVPGYRVHGGAIGIINNIFRHLSEERTSLKSCTPNISTCTVKLTLESKYKTNKPTPNKQKMRDRTRVTKNVLCSGSASCAPGTGAESFGYCLGKNVHLIFKGVRVYNTSFMRAATSHHELEPGDSERQV